MKRARTAAGVLTSLVCFGGALGCGDGGGGATEFRYCEVTPILERYCWRCHGDEHSAPMSLTSWEAIQADYPAGSGTPVWERMEQVVAADIMPLALTLDPPVEALPEAEKQRLLEWLAEGAPRGDCP